jgi:RNA polymerase sigma factor (sigma-70 family)
MLNRGAGGEVSTMRTFLHGLFARLGPSTEGDPSDDQLLSAFVSSRDEGAFHQIVRRHGPMVHGVCRRVLRNDADADDAFQAVFVVFLRKANTVRPGNLLGNWLYGVAVNVARKGCELNKRRKLHELASVQASDGSEHEPDPELREVIDQELSRLPADYRAAVVTCDLEGRTRREAASQLGWSEGTVASRLARARSILADRLMRRGITLPAAGLAGVFALGSPAYATVPKVPLTGHSEVVETLARETVKAMTSKLKTTAVLVMAVAGLVGTGVVLACGSGMQPTAPTTTAAKPAPAQPSETRTDDNPLAAWSKPAAGMDPGTDKLVSGNGGEAKPTHFVLQNPARDITIVSDRDEKFVEFFRRQRVLIAGVTDKDLNAAMEAKGPSGKIFVDYASYNEDGVMNASYGSYIRLAPIDTELSDLILSTPTPALVMLPDAKEKELWHVVGVTSRSSVGFFASKEKKGKDDFAPRDLLFAQKK